MLSIPHMIVVFIVVLVVFGPQKLPELARSLGKLMAEFRKASGDFKSAFEEEMRDLERQTRLAELKKQAAEAAAAASDGAKNPVPPATLGSPAGSEGGGTDATDAAGGVAADNRQTEAPIITPVAEAVPRLDAAASESAATLAEGGAPTEGSAGNGASGSSASTSPSTSASASTATSANEDSPSPSHDQQQPA
jgi:sec-independent protein translocase protein TatB